MNFIQKMWGTGQAYQQPAQHQGYGYQQQAYRPSFQQNAYQPPPPPQSQQGQNNFLWQVFSGVDKDRNGQITQVELQQALANGTWSPFNPETVRLMILMFDRDRSGTIDFNEFSALWKYVSDWSACFRSFDRDNSGNIDHNELRNALTNFGYRLSDPFMRLLIQRYDRSRQGRINFDDFIQLCVNLQTLSNAFAEKDTDRDGVIRISYEEFLTMVISAM